MTLTENQFIDGLRRFFASRYFMIAMMVLCAIVNACSAELLFIPILILLLDIIFVVSKNFLDSLLPILLLNALALHTAKMEAALFQYAWLAIPTVISLVLHFVLYPVKLKIGKSFYGLLAISFALVLGGIGSISVENYFSLASLYFVLFLGFGMILFYLGMRAYNFSTEAYDAKDRLMEILYCLGIYCAFFIIEQAIGMWVRYGTVQSYVGANDICVFMLFSLPAFFYFARRHYAHFYVGVALYAVMLLTSSISAMVVGGVILVFGLFYLWFYAPKRHLPTYINFAVVLLLGSILVIHYRLYDFSVLKNMFLNEENGRMDLIRVAWENFLENPIFGAGIGNTEGYETTSMGIPWTHNLIFQILGSMGIIGILAYGFHFFVRARLVFKRPNAFRMAISLCYLGIFLISMLQPGEFCPMPYEMMAVLFFVFLELTEETDDIPQLTA